MLSLLLHFSLFSLSIHPSLSLHFTHSLSIKHRLTVPTFSSMYVAHPAFTVLSMTYILPAVRWLQMVMSDSTVVRCWYSNDILANFSFEVSVEVDSMVVRVISISGL